MPGQPREVRDEHRALMDAALARDADRCAALLTEHFEGTTRGVLASPSGTPPGHAPPGPAREADSRPAASRA